MSVVHLELLVVVDNEENHVEISKYFQKCHILSKAFDISKKTPLTSNSF